MEEKKIDNKTNQTNNNNQTTQKAKTKKANEDFKRKYFDYYDDIKISDRQDW